MNGQSLIDSLGVALPLAEMSPPTPVPAATKRRYQKRNHAAREIRITREVRSLLLNLDDSCQLYLSQCAVLGNPTIRSLASFAVFNPPADGSTTTGRPVVLPAR